MSRPTWVVALRARLDTEAARRLADYADLDDAGVTRAVEQIHTQHWGRWDLPAHLATLDVVSIVCVQGGRITRHHIERGPGSDESAMLDQLTAIGGDTPVDLVDWDGHDIDTLIARFFARDRVLPRGLAQAHRHHLAGWLAPTAADHPAPNRVFETACRSLFGEETASDDAQASDAWTTVADRTRLWWRLETTRRRLHPARRTDLIAQLQALNSR